MTDKYFDKKLIVTETVHGRAPEYIIRDIPTPEYITYKYITEFTFPSSTTIKMGSIATVPTPPSPVTSTSNPAFKRNETLWKLYKTFIDTNTFRVGYVWGPPGIGKTFGAQRWGLDNKVGSKRVYSVTLTEETPSAELRGHFVPKGGEFIWHDGPIVKAMREGARVVVNEISHSSPDCLSFFYVALESPETAIITLPTGEDVRPAKGFQVILTDNVPPSHLPQPLYDRMDACFEVIGPSPEAVNSYPENFRNVVLGSSLADGSKRISLRSWETINRLTEGGMDVDVAGLIVLGLRWDGVKLSVNASKIFSKTK